MILSATFTKANLGEQEDRLWRGGVTALRRHGKPGLLPIKLDCSWGRKD